MLVRVLGPTSLGAAGTQQAITSRAMRSLLASLALNAGSHVPVDVLTDWVWGEDDLPEHPVPALQTIVSRLRRTLNDAGVEATLETVSGGYLLRVPPEHVDAVRFESQVLRARELTHQGHPEQAVQVLDEALALWGSAQALIDVTQSRAALSEAVRLDELRMAAAHDRIELLLDLRPAADLLPELARLTSRYPLREGFARQYMIALDSCGQRADALVVYRRLAHTMRDQLGVGPGPALRAIHANLLAERPADTVGDRPRDEQTPPRSAAPAAVSWPVRVGTPPALAAAFQVRPQVRARIEAALGGEARSVVVTQVMAGDGGVGKTQLATAVFHDAMDSGEVDLGVWVTANSRDAVLAAYSTAYTIVDPPSAAVHQEIEARAAAFLAWLADTDHSWMIVLDDVADPADLNQLRPRGAAGRVLVTTRRRDAAMTAIGSIIDVGLFSPAESVTYLHERLRQPGLPSGVLDDAEQLAADLGHLPLALAQAASVIINDAITCADYRALLADRTLGLAEVFPLDPKASGDDYARALPAAWSLATERAATTDPLVKPMLALVAVLDPNGIPEAVLLTPAATAHLGLCEGPATGAKLARSAIRTAHQFSLLTHTPDDPTRSVRMHALAQRAAVEHFSAGDLPSVVTAAADALVQVWPEIVADPDLSQVLRANTTALATRHPSALWHSGIHPVVFKAGWDLGLSGQAGKAVAYYTDLVATAHTTLGPDHPATLKARHQLVEWRASGGDDVRAMVAELEGILADRLRVLGADHRDTFYTRYDLADWRGMSGDADGAVTDLDELVADTTRVLGCDDLETLRARHDLAYWRGDAGDVHGSVAAFSELLADSIRVRGADHHVTLGIRHYLARAQGKAGDPVRAAGELSELLGDALRVLGPDNPYTLVTRMSLAHWRGGAGDPRLAVADLADLLPDMLRVLGPDHPETFAARHEHAHWQGECGDYAAAVSAYQDLLTLSLRVLGPDHPRTVSTGRALDEWTTSAAQPPRTR